MSIPVSIDFDERTLRASGPLLRQELLRSGDVLLVRGRGPKSRVIALASGGDYSHAAIWLPIGYPDAAQLFLAEADAVGVGFTMLAPVIIRNNDGSQLASVYRVPGNPLLCALLRHPAMEGVAKDRIEEVSRLVQDEAFYKTYSAFPRLLEAANLPGSLDPLFNAIARLAEGTRNDEGARGSFCSELVGMFYSKLGLDLFLDGRRPEQISPNDLVTSECSLQVVSEAFIDPKTLPAGVTGYGSVFEDPRRDGGLPRMIQNRSATERLSASFESFASRVRRTSLVTSRLIKEVREQSEEGFIRHIALVERLGERERADRVRGYAASSTFGHALLRITLDRDGVMRNGQTPLDEMPRWNDASFTLQRIAHKLISDSNQALLRDSCLLCLRVLRKTKRTGFNPIEYARFHRTRRTVIRGWVAQNKRSKETDEHVSGLLETGVLSEQSRVYVSKILQETYDAVTSEFEWDEPTESFTSATDLPVVPT